MAPALLQAKFRHWFILLGAVDLENGSRNASVTSEILSYPLRLRCRREARPKSDFMFLVINAYVSLNSTIQHLIIILKCLGLTIFFGKSHQCSEVFSEFMEFSILENFIDWPVATVCSVCLYQNSEGIFRV